MVHHGVWRLLPMVHCGTASIRKANANRNRSKKEPRAFKRHLTAFKCDLAVVSGDAVSQFAIPQYRGDQDSCPQGKGPHCPVRQTWPDSAGTCNQSAIDASA